MQIHCQSTTTQLPEILTQILKCLLSQSIVIWYIVCLSICRLFVHSYLFIHSFSRTWPEVDPTSRPVCPSANCLFILICSLIHSQGPDQRSTQPVDPVCPSANCLFILICSFVHPPGPDQESTQTRVITNQDLLRLEPPSSTHKDFLHIVICNKSNLNTTFYQDLLQPSRSW